MAKGHIRPRGPGAWELKYDAGVDATTGKRIVRYRTVRGAKRDAQRELREILTALETGVWVDPAKITVGAWLSQWLEEARATVAPRTLQRYREIVDLHLIPALGILALAKLAPVHIQKHYSDALAGGRKDGKGGLSAQTVVHHARVLSLALRRARALRMIHTNPAEDAVPPAPAHREIEALEPADARALLAVTRDRCPWLYPIILLGLATGLRRGELLGLRWRDMNLDQRSLTVAQSLEQTKAGLRVKAPKTRRSRRGISLSDSLIEEMRTHKARQAAERLALGLGRDPADLVFTRLNGDPVRPDGVTQAFARMVKLAKIRHASVHCLRHTHATDLLRAGVHPKIVSERLGHASIAITMDTYTHAIPGLQEDAAQRIDAALRDVIGG